MHRILLAAGFACSLVAAGCGSTEPPPAAAKPAAPSLPPEKIVYDFLEAVRTGNDEAASNLLTPLARQKTSEMDLKVAPPGSDTAKFKVGEVEMVEEDGAHVASEWTDVDESGQPHTDPIVWMLQRDEQGWRIAGMATRVFEDQPPLFLNFEDPQDMIRKQQLVAQEMQRRSQAETTAAAPNDTKSSPPVESTANPMEKTKRR